ncbi:MAG: YdjY domain-containing protein [Gemmataceae bacterium]|nr:YdjY domain-containing protein [Gemmataceae bacterium]MCI0737860.1 YdjY domain-containing protein [Gemmataceae bacterium]
MCKTLVLLLPAMVLIAKPVSFAGKENPGFSVDAAKKTITIAAKIAPRMLPHLKEVYPIEVIACWPHPKGKKAHETIVTIEAKPSAIHKALEDLGLKAGKPVMGESKEPPQGPAVNVYLDLPTPEGEFKRISIDRALVDKRTGKPFPKDVTWRFTGSVHKQTDPGKKELTYGADDSGTLGVIFPVSNETVLQTSLTMEYEKFMKLEPNSKILPKEGTLVRLVIEVAGK